MVKKKDIFISFPSLKPTRSKKKNLKHSVEGKKTLIFNETRKWYNSKLQNMKQVYQAMKWNGERDWVYWEPKHALSNL